MVVDGGFGWWLRKANTQESDSLILPSLFSWRPHSQPDLSNETSLCFDTGYSISKKEVRIYCSFIYVQKR